MNQNPKYQQIMQTASRLFQRHGYKRVTIEEICAKANVSKVTFYKFFSNKLDICKKVIDQMVELGSHEYKNIMNQPVSYRVKVEKVLEFKVRATREFGNEFLKELLGADESIRLHILMLQEQNANLAIEMLEQGKKEGVIREDLSPEFYMYMLGHINTMVEDEQLKKIIPDPRKRAEELVKFWFYGMFDAIG